MAIKAKFECRMNEEYGTLGWAMVGKPYMEPLTGMAIPHDMMEHLPTDDGSVEHEFMALGASLLVRDGDNYYGYKGNRHNAATNIASDFILHYHFLQRESLPLSFREPGRYQIPEDITNELDEIMSEGVRVLRGEDLDDWREFFSEEQQRKAKGWFVKGYRRALKRYKGIPAHQLCYLFMEVEKAVDKLPLEEGYILSVSIDLKNGEVKAFTDFPEENY